MVSSTTQSSQHRGTGHRAPVLTLNRTKDSKEMAPGTYTELFIKKNPQFKKTFSHWFFLKGMLFLDDKKWWGDGGRRSSIHEGIDLAHFINHADEKVFLDETTHIPTLESGTLVRSLTDYLGTTLIIAHDRKKNTREKQISLYGHTTPLSGIYEGKNIRKGEVIATIANKNPRRILPHLHLSVGLLPETTRYNDLKWETLHDSQIIQLKNPIQYL